jgi:hypothetical protein
MITNQYVFRAWKILLSGKAAVKVVDYFLKQANICDFCAFLEKDQEKTMNSQVKFLTVQFIEHVISFLKAVNKAGNKKELLKIIIRQIYR